jgi:hypothetical protein
MDPSNNYSESLRRAMLTYRDFVEELRPLTAQAMEFWGSLELNGGLEFRKWRHGVSDLIGRIEEAGYSVYCIIDTRQFDELGGYSHTSSLDERVDAFNRDLEDTITELETVISRFDKFGDPKAPPQADAPTPLQMPEKVTAAWIWNNAPITLWWKLAGVAALIFVTGIAIGQSSLYAEVLAKLSPATAKVSDK